ncbi:MAG: FapA family protein, partial [Oscillospiraceae bacterium]
VVAPSVKPARISAGQNTTFSEDGTQIYADCDGQITYKSDKISVNKELSVKNVNNETGNLDFAGNISIQGDVYTGFTVKSGGNITIGGNVEGATIIAEGNIVIRKGINGSDGGSAVAGGSFTSKFIENATVTAVDSIQAEAVLNSRLTCDGSVILSGRRGCLIGGDCRAGTQISAKEIGNDANIETKVSVDILPKLKKELEELDIQVSECEQVKEHLAELYGNLYQPEEKNESKLAALLELAFLYCRVQVEATPVYNRREVISNKINNLTSGSIVVKGSIYQNVIIDINGCIAKTNDTKQFCHIHTKDDEIVYGLANSSI